jgi:hypothetical protein
VPQTYEKLVFTQVSHRDIVHHNSTEFAAKKTLFLWSFGLSYLRECGRIVGGDGSLPLSMHELSLGQ